MNALFNINFRREAYLREMAHARRRVVMLGVWLAYFGVMAVLLGLYGLNCVSLHRRLHRVERQIARLQAVQGGSNEWKVPQSELVMVEQYVTNPRRWHDRLARLADLLPPNMRLTSLVVNPQNMANPVDLNSLVITGVLRAEANQDRMQGVVQFATRLRSDSLFSAGYENIKLSSTRVFEESNGSTEFVIECR